MEPTTITYAELLERLQQMPKELLNRKVVFGSCEKQVNYVNHEVIETIYMLELQDFNPLELYENQLPEVWHTQTKRVECQQ